MNAEMIEGRFLTLDRAATYLGIAPRSLLRLVERGQIRAVRIEGLRRLLFDRRALEALVVPCGTDRPVI